MTDKLDITLRIADVKLSLTINRDEEQLLRDVTKEVNHVFDAYKQRFGNSSNEEILAKVTLLFAKGYLTMTAQAKELDTLLGDFEKSLDNILLDIDTSKA